MEETSGLKRFFTWLKGNWKLVAFGLILGLLIGRSIVREIVITAQTKKIEKLESRINVLDQDRQFLEKQLIDLNLQFNEIVKLNDSMKVALMQKQKELEDMEQKHKKELDSLMSVPPDTIYKKLNILYPNFDGSEQRFPFSQSQIIPIYRTTLSYPMVIEEFKVQRKALETCTSLNTGYESGITNLKSQILNLESNVKKADEQIKNYKTQIVVLNNRDSRKSFWNRFLVTSNIVFAAVAVLK